jgi:hypothetical protein
MLLKHKPQSHYVINVGKAPLDCYILGLLQHNSYFKLYRIVTN